MTESELRDMEWYRTGRILGCEIDGCENPVMFFIMEESDPDDRLIFLCKSHHRLCSGIASLNPATNQQKR